MDTEVLGLSPEQGQLVQKGLAVLTAVSLQGGIKIPLGMVAPDHRQPVRGKAEHRRAEDGNKGHVLPGIVQNLQQGV